MLKSFLKNLLQYRQSFLHQPVPIDHPPTVYPETASLHVIFHSSKDT